MLAEKPVALPGVRYVFFSSIKVGGRPAFVLAIIVAAWLGVAIIVLVDLGVMTMNAEKIEANPPALAREPSPRFAAGRPFAVLKTAGCGRAALEADAVQDGWEEF